MYYGTCDVKNAFYQHELPAWIATYFSLAGVKAYEVGVKYMDGREVDPNPILYPQLRVVPMGWSWGVALVQEAHLHLLAECGGLEEQRRAVDFRPPTRPWRCSSIFNVHRQYLCGWDLGRVGERVVG